MIRCLRLRQLEHNIYLTRANPLLQDPPQMSQVFSRLILIFLENAWSKNSIAILQCTDLSAWFLRIRIPPFDGKHSLLYDWRSITMKYQISMLSFVFRSEIQKALLASRCLTTISRTLVKKQYRHVTCFALQYCSKDDWSIPKKTTIIQPPEMLWV